MILIFRSLINHSELPDPGVRNEKQRTDWADVLEQAKNGNFESIPASAYIHCRRTLHDIRRDILTARCPPNLSEPCGLWLVGPSGCGKSRYARVTYPNAYLKPINKWWDGYMGEKEVIFEDWDETNSASLHALKIWADCYQFPAEQKGYTIKIRPSLIVVTSNYTIEELTLNYPKFTQPLLRRFTVFSDGDLFCPWRRPGVFDARPVAPLPAPAVAPPNHEEESIIISDDEEEAIDSAAGAIDLTCYEAVDN